MLMERLSWSGGGTGGQVLVDGDPAAVVGAGEDDGLPLVDRFLAGVGGDPGFDVVTEDGSVAEVLDELCRRGAAEDAEAVLFHPLLPERAVLGRGAEPLRGGVEDEGRVGGEGAEVVVEAALGEGGDKRVRGGPDFLDGGGAHARL